MLKYPLSWYKKILYFYGMFQNPPTYIDLSEASLRRSVTQAFFFKSQPDQMSFKGESVRVSEKGTSIKIDFVWERQVTYKENSVSVVGDDKTEL